MVSLNIKSIGIIGAGPAGLASLYEFLNTSADGKSTVGTGKRPENPAFTKIVAFEQKDHAGGIWAPATKEGDLDVPPQEILDTGKYNDPSVIRPKNELPGGIETATQDKPVVTPKDTLQNELEWKRSGVYPFLFTNIPSRFTRFSYLPDPEKYHDKSRKIYPFLFHQELEQRFSDFVESEGLDKHIRLNTTVEDVHKNSKGKWVISVRHKNPQTNQNEWYQEEFDAVVVANGHFTVPYYPSIPGFAEFNAKNPNVLLHVKSFRNVDDFKDKDVLLIGGSISTGNVIQHIIPVAKSVTNARRGKCLVFDFLNEALVIPEIDAKGPVEKFDPESGEVYFTDGSHKKFDKILFTTGYHFSFPFLQDTLEVVNPSNSSRTKGFYYDTFFQTDPTLGAAGIAVSFLNFHTIEASAAALAGVWSGSKELPTVQEQQEWEATQVAEKGDTLFFHYYHHSVAKKEFVDKLAVYFAEGRHNPLEKDGAFIEQIDQGVDTIEKFYYLFKDNKLSIEETSLPVE